MTTWEQWATAVLAGIGAPADQTNIDTLWAWSNKESGADVMRWNNPLNTTEPWPGAQNMNSVGVKRYASVNDGVLATVATLDNGYYPTILANLRSSLSRSQWGNACAELGKWGTGCGWLTSVYGAAPGAILGLDVITDPTQANLLVEAAQYANLAAAFIEGETRPNVRNVLLETLQAVQALQVELDAIKAAVAALQASQGTTAASAPLKLGGSFTGTLSAE